MKICAACHEDLPKDKFSKKQWKLDQRKCKVCVADNREVQPLPPSPPTNNNNGSVDSNEPNVQDDGLANLFDCMSIEEMQTISDEMIPPSGEDLFKQPPKNEDCPICFLMMPSLSTGYRYNSCCGKVICSGCIYANSKLHEDNLCPFCRTPSHTTDKEAMIRNKKRIEKGDVNAIHNQGCYYNTGSDGFPQNWAKALELWHKAGQMAKAGELGSAKAYYSIGCAYDRGRGVERNEEKARHYWELAAMRGNIIARHNLACLEGKSKNFEKALKHLMIAVRSGDVESLKKIGWLYSNGHATKEDYGTALRVRQAYLDEIRSDQRDEAAAVDDMYTYY